MSTPVEPPAGAGRAPAGPDPVPPDGGDSPRRPSLLLGLVLVAVIAGTVALVALAVTGGGGSGSSETADCVGLDCADQAVGATVPDVALERFDGSTASFADYAGTPLVVNFFASWCAPCVREMPDFEAVHQTLGDAVTILGVNNQDRVADGERIVAETGVTYDVVRDPSGEALVELGGIVMPTTAFVGAAGEIVAVHNGELSAAELTSRIEELFGVTVAG